MSPKAHKPRALVRWLTSPTARRLTRTLMRDRTPVFMLHRLDVPAHDIHGHSVDFIRSAILALRNAGFEIVSLRTVIETWRRGEEAGPDWAVFTIDDGFADQARIVREAFAPLDCPVTLFLITGFIDGEIWPWDDQIAHLLRAAARRNFAVTLAGQPMSLDLTTASTRNTAIHLLRDHVRSIDSDPYAITAELAQQLEVTRPAKPPAEYEPLSWDTARALEREGAEFGAHSVTHRTFSKLTDADSRAELAGSWSRLRQELRNPVPILAWPRGRMQDFGARDLEYAREAGFEACVTTEPGYASGAGSDPLARLRLRRFALPETVTKVLRYSSWLERARELLPL